jgi:acyl dehydratase
MGQNKPTAITEAELKEARGYIGSELTFESWNVQASRDSIRHYCYGIGDDNPLWCDTTYGPTSSVGTTIAPPTFLYTVADTTCSPGLGGLQPIYAGARWEFYEPAKLDDMLSYEAHCADARLVRGRIGGNMLLQTADITYHRGQHHPIARVRADTWRVALGADGLSYQPKPRYTPTEEDWEKIEQGVKAERLRGAEPFFFQDVRVGDRLTPVVKGPIDQITMTAYYAGQIGSPGYKACELRWRNWLAARDDPGRLPNHVDKSYFAQRVLPSLGHQDDAAARQIGMPAAYDNGPMRIGWLSHLVTNWCGDNGWLSTLDVRLRRPNILGDVTWCHGTVVHTEPGPNGHGIVRIELNAVNQDGVRHAEGIAEVLLPTKAGSR